MSSNPFDYVKSINESKTNLMVDEMTERAYVPYVTNRALSYFLDTCFQANEMNRLHHLGKKPQYQFLLNTVKARKRWAGKWHKKEVASENVETLMLLYGYSRAKAEEAAILLTPDQMKQLKQLVDPGGIVTTKRK